jgi:hypothetical protein
MAVSVLEPGMYFAIGLPANQLVDSVHGLRFSALCSLVDGVESNPQSPLHISVTPDFLN